MPGLGSPKAMPDSRSISAPKPIRSEATSATASSGIRAKVEETSRNSLMNTPNGGIPAIATTPATRPQPSAGCVTVSPRICDSRCVPFTWAMLPTAKKIADFVRLCIVMCSRPAKFASGPPMPKANAISPMCSTDE